MCSMSAAASATSPSGERAGRSRRLGGGRGCSSEAVALASRRAAEQGERNVSCRCGDAVSLDLERQFDAAVGRFVLMFLGDATAALADLAKHLRPGGLVAFLEWAASRAWRRPGAATGAGIRARLPDRDVRSIGRKPQHGCRALLEDARCRLRARPATARGDRHAHGRGFVRTATLGAVCEKRAPGRAASTACELRRTSRSTRSSSACAMSFSPYAACMPLTYLMVGQWARKPA